MTMSVSHASRWIRWSVMLAILVSCVGCDQFTKHVARQTLEGTPPRSFLADTVRLVYAENPGAFLGLGRQLPASARWTLLVVVNTLVASALAVAIFWQSGMPVVRAAACALLAGGAVGNLIDRVRFDGLVIDFMNVGVGPLRTGIFNVADVAISCGAILLVLPHFAAKAPVESPPQP